MKNTIAVLAIVVTVITIVSAKPIVKNEQERVTRIVTDERGREDIREIDKKIRLTTPIRITGERAQRTYRIKYQQNEVHVWVMMTSLITGEFSRSMLLTNIPASLPHAGVIAMDNYGSNSWDTIRWYTRNDAVQTNTASAAYQSKELSYNEFIRSFTAPIETNHLHEVFLLIRAAETNTMVEGSSENTSQIIVITVP